MFAFMGIHSRLGDNPPIPSVSAYPLFLGFSFARMKILFEAGTLWSSMLERTELALACGALERIPTRNETVEERGIRFLVPVVENIERKRTAGRVQKREGTNPFLPYEDDLFVADISETHVGLLNKFNVVEHHLLIVTREFEEQDDLLNVRDFESMWACLAEFDGLAFYNAGTIAGASQPHKHLQQVPVPLGFGPERIPLEPFLAAAGLDRELGSVPGLPFVHAVAKVESLSALEASEAACRTEAIYQQMLREVGLENEPGPYNLLVTREWMLMVPRTKETYESISVNALGFAGSILVRDEKELELVRAHGPMAVLEHVAIGHSYPTDDPPTPRLRRAGR
jgi:ATP adenylyltransferase